MENAREAGLDCLVCLGGGGTQKNAWHLHKAGGLDVLTLPKTIDNDVAETDVSFGFDTAVQICTEAIDRLHTTATSHDRIIVVEVMGHNAGWLALAAGLAGGADVVLIPELPYDTEMVAAYLLRTAASVRPEVLHRRGRRRGHHARRGGGGRGLGREQEQGQGGADRSRATTAARAICRTSRASCARIWRAGSPATCSA